LVVSRDTLSAGIDIVEIPKPELDVSFPED